MQLMRPFIFEGFSSDITYFVPQGSSRFTGIPDGCRHAGHKSRFFSINYTHLLTVVCRNSLVARTSVI